MPGVPGRGGPPPKRSDQRRRQNKPETPIESAPAVNVKPPAADRKWHRIARRWYESLARSGQSVFYEASDWETAYLLAESMSRELKPQQVGTDAAGEPIYAEVPLKGASLAAYLKAMTALLVTEGDRRRSRIELERQKGDTEEAGDVSWIDDARGRLRAAD